MKLNANDQQSLQMFCTKLKGGFLSHATELLNGNDPTGGLVALDDQVYSLYIQYHAECKNTH